MASQASFLRILQREDPNQGMVDYAALEAKREYNIELREKRYQEKQVEEAKQRRRKKELDGQRAAQKLAAVVQGKEVELALGLEKKSHNLEDDYRNRVRDAAIMRREEKWQKKTAEYIQGVINEHLDEQDRQEELRQSAKAVRIQKLKDEAKARAEKKEKREEMEEIRLEQITGRDDKRTQKELTNAHELKEILVEEREYRMEQVEAGQPVTVSKNDLVSSLIKIPTVSELFCACKDETANIKFLKQCDLEALAKLNGMAPLLYIKKVNEEHDASRYCMPSSVPQKEEEEGQKKKKKRF